jgi:pimeloyl-ACP methyl ester carboxylesterase
MPRVGSGSGAVSDRGEDDMRSLAIGAVVALLVGLRPAAAERRTLFVEDGPVRIQVVAEGEGPSIVLLPSSGRDSFDYDDVAAGLAGEGFRVLRPQPRGIAGSTGPMKDLGLRDLAGDVATVIRREGGGRAVIVGHAFGNWVARMIATDHPEIVRGVVLAAASAKASPRELAAALATAADASAPRDDRLAALRLAFFAPGNDPAPWLDGWHPAYYAATRNVGRSVPQEVWWPAGTAPILDLQAAQDPWRPRATAGELKAEFGERVTVAVVDGASHALIPEQPRAVVRAIADWIRRLP